MKQTKEKKNLKSSKNKIWETVVIGGGPAGMMAAGRAAELGKSVLLVEKNSSLGKKLLITGGGRCNLTNNKPEMRDLVSSYKNKPKALFSVFSQFGVDDTLEFFNSRGMETKVENEGRVFPTSDSAESVWDVVVNYIKKGGVKIQTNTTVTKLSVEKTTNQIKIHTQDGVLKAKKCIVATGGTSHPETGSTGDGYKWLKDLGHTIIDNNFALVPIALTNKWVKDLSGVSIQDAKINIIQDGKKLESRSGKMLFTHFGISGPIVLNMSSKVGDLIQYGDVILELDLVPDFDYAQLRREFHDLLARESNKKIKNTLDELIPAPLIPVVLELTKVDGDKPNHSVSKDDRICIMKLIKGIKLYVKGLLGADKAIVSSGGVKIDEVNFQTMESRIIPNLYIIGDVLNIDRPSGGYSLQICWASGYVAGGS